MRFKRRAVACICGAGGLFSLGVAAETGSRRVQKKTQSRENTQVMMTIIVFRTFVDMSFCVSLFF